LHFDNDSTKDDKSQGRMMGNFNLEDAKTERGGNSTIQKSGMNLNPRNKGLNRNISSDKHEVHSNYIGSDTRENSSGIIRSSAYKENKFGFASDDMKGRNVKASISAVKNT
jgi:hypothetical protein